MMNNKPVAWTTDGREVMRLDNDGSGFTAHFSRAEPDIVTVKDKDSTEIIRITPDGRVFWKQREVETDDDFRNAMLDLAKALKGEFK